MAVVFQKTHRKFPARLCLRHLVSRPSGLHLRDFVSRLGCLKTWLLQDLAVSRPGYLKSEYANTAWVAFGNRPVRATGTGTAGLPARSSDVIAGNSFSLMRSPRRCHTHDDGIHDGAAQHKHIDARPHASDTKQKASECVMSYGSYYDAAPRLADKWIPRDTSEININDERELAYWTNELRISVGDLIWLVEKYGTNADRIRAMVK